jgi:deoxyxylulose-5-phosphate synthase
MPDIYVDQMSPERMLENAGLDQAGIVASVVRAIGRNFVDQSVA